MKEVTEYFGIERVLVFFVFWVFFFRSMILQHICIKIALLSYRGEMLT